MLAAGAARRQRFYLARGQTSYREPIDLPQQLSDDGPRLGALASLNR